MDREPLLLYFKLIRRQGGSTVFRFSISISCLTVLVGCLGLFLWGVSGSMADDEVLPLELVPWGGNHEVKAMAWEPILGSYLVVSGCYPELVSNNIGYTFLVDSLYVADDTGQWIFPVDLPRLHNRKSLDWQSPIAISPINGLVYQVHQEKLGGIWSPDKTKVDHRCRLTILDPFFPGRKLIRLIGGRRATQFNEIHDLIYYPAENLFMFADNSNY